MQYKVKYSYMRDGKRVYEEDTLWAESAHKAVFYTECEYADLPNLRTEEVWRDDGDCWAKVDEIMWDY